MLRAKIKTVSIEMSVLCRHADVSGCLRLYVCGEVERGGAGLTDSGCD